MALDRIVDKGVLYNLDRPLHEEFGDWASNVALILGKENNEKPQEVAKRLVAKLSVDQKLMDLIEKIEIAGPGFINFYIKPDWYLHLLKKAVESGFGQGQWGKGKKVLVEYSSPNIAKRFSAGHLRSTIIGDSLARLYHFSGWRVVTDNHLGDWGTQFGMIIAAVEEKNLNVDELSVTQLEELYVDFNKRLETDEALRDKAREAFARLENGDAQARKIWQSAKNVSMAEFQQIYDRLGIKIDYAYGEADYEEEMKEIIPLVREKIGRESEGAVIVEFVDLPPAMLLKSNGTTTYFTRDLATVKFRQENGELKSDLYIYEVAVDQTLHFRQVFAAAENMGWAKKTQLVHVAHGLMTLPEGKMSTRKGRTVKLEELLSQAVEQAAEMGSTDRESKEIIAIGAVKFNELRHSPKSNYVFVWREALNMEGNSGPYLQYAYVRAFNVLKDQEEGLSLPQTYPFNKEELTLARYISRFPETVKLAAGEFAPNFICSYLHELSSRFNAFYNQHRILQADTPAEKAVRIFLTRATAQVLKSGLDLLGIETVEKM